MTLLGRVMDNLKYHTKKTTRIDSITNPNDKKNADDLINDID